MDYTLNENMLNLTSMEGNENQNQELAFHMYHVDTHTHIYVYGNGNAGILWKSFPFESVYAADWLLTDLCWGGDGGREIRERHEGRSSAVA